MTELEFHKWAVWVQFIVAAVTFAAVINVIAPYGRYERVGWGPRLSKKYSWLLMESPAVVLFIVFFLNGENRFELIPLLFLVMWQFHYLNRAFIFPLRMRFSSQMMPLLVPVLGVFFNTLNAYVNARWIAHFGNYEPDWLSDPRFIAGTAIFFAGWFGNFHSDSILRTLRKPGETTYRIPRGGLFRWVSAPNYSCEILMWTGWAVASWSAAGLAFAVYTVANLAPRAFSHHAWYRTTFDDYPSERKVLVPRIF